MAAFFFDADGTLISHQTKEVSKSTRYALEELKKKGHLIFLATGRHPVELAYLPGHDLKFDGYLCLNGQIGLDSNQTILYTKEYDEESKNWILKTFEQKEIPLSLVDEQGIYINFVNEQVQRTQASITSVVPPIQPFQQRPFFQATCFLSEKEELNYPLPTGARYVRWYDYGADIIPKDGGKAYGYQRFCEIYKLNPSETIAFGDGGNDMDLLKAVGYSFAMGNAINSLKEVADEVCGSVDEDGIYLALKKHHFL